MAQSRLAGELLLTALAAGGSAAGANAIAHDEMDGLAQMAKNFTGRLEASDPRIQQSYMHVAGQGEMSNMDRLVVTSILRGSMDKRIAQQGLPEGGEIKADTKAGVEAIATAYLIRAQNPQLAEQLGSLTKQELELFSKERLSGVSSAQVMAAAEQGAGITPVPALIGGGLGGGAALLGVIAARRGRPN